MKFENTVTMTDLRTPISVNQGRSFLLMIAFPLFPLVGVVGCFAIITLHHRYRPLQIRSEYSSHCPSPIRLSLRCQTPHKARVVPSPKMDESRTTSASNNPVHFRYRHSISRVLRSPLPPLTTLSFHPPTEDRNRRPCPVASSTDPHKPASAVLWKENCSVRRWNLPMRKAPSFPRGEPKRVEP